ncbi:agmatinase [Roseicella aquatilis]|uniref:Agmatinase n=1 Tax=Roseicella aquatilis TaxID=2527868 RepID=A0A4R4DP09_9PROT|nr:agmatinase [Roseicella aquatilis]TCZ63549.1 agmatinase [Roseicella aquatilis]
MAGTPTFATPPGFLGLAQQSRDGITRQGRGAAFCIAGVPLDIGTTNRAGTRDGPAAIRRASRMLVDGVHPQHWTDPRNLDIADIGDFAIALGDIPASLDLIERQAAECGHLVTLGGEHLVTLPLLRALAKRLGGPLGLLHMDAHVDTWETNFGQSLAHGSVFFHAIREGLVEPRRMIQLGIRSPVDRETWDWTLGQGVTVVTAQEAHESSPPALAARVRAVLGDGPCYLSFDIDALDPAFAPGTGTPEVGGLASWQAQGILRRLGGLAWAGMDLVEVSPAYDQAEITALAGATMAWEYLALLAGP